MCLPLTREVSRHCRDGGRERVNIVKNAVFLSLSLATLDSSLVRGSLELYDSINICTISP